MLVVPAIPSIAAQPSSAQNANDTWCVMRQDDNGNTFVIADRLSQTDAETTMRAYERRGHKQVYWIRRQ